MLTTGENATNALLKHPRELFFGQTRRLSKFQLARAAVRAGSTSPGSGEPVLLGKLWEMRLWGCKCSHASPGGWWLRTAVPGAFHGARILSPCPLPSSSQPASICVPCREVRRTAGEVMGGRQSSRHSQRWVWSG